MLDKLSDRYAPESAILHLTPLSRRVEAAIAASRRLAALQPYSGIAQDNNERPAVIMYSLSNQSQLYN